MKPVNALHSAIWLRISILLALAGLTACSGTLQVGTEHTTAPDHAGTATTSAGATEISHLATQVAAQTTSVPVPTPIAPLPGMVYRMGDELWQMNLRQGPMLIFERTDALLSPDGTRALYLEKDAGDLDLWLADLITGERRNLTRTPDLIEGNFRWWTARPNVVLFSSLPQKIKPGPGVTGFLAAVDVDGGSYRVLDDQNHTGGLPAPSPDGQTIAYGSGSTGWLYRWETGVEVFDPADYGLSGYGDIHIGSPAWSPDGKRLAWVVGGNFTADTSFQMGVGVFDLETRTAKLLHLYEPVGGDGWPQAPIWSPDGKWLAFSAWAQQPDQAGVWVVRADGQQQETHLGGVKPVWDPKGRWLALNRDSQNDEAYSRVAEVGTWSLLRTDLPPAGQIVDWLAVDVEHVILPNDTPPTPPVATTISAATPTPTPHMDVWDTYSNPVFRVSLQYPADWRPELEYGGRETGEIRFGGINGFFQIGAVDASAIDDAAVSEAEHHLRPYGSRPIIENLRVHDQQARLILPSEDQPIGMGYQSALIVRYPQPVNVAGVTYQFLVLWADQAHIRTIAQTVRFAADSAPAATDAPMAPTAGEELPPGLVYTTYDGLWLVDDAGQPVRIHNNPQAVLSPDGTRLISYDGPQQDLWLLDLTQDAMWNLTRTPDRLECCFRWWPERSDMVLFSSIEQHAERGPGLLGHLSAVNLDGKGYQILDSEHDTGPGQLAPSPDGQTIAYGGGSTGWLYRRGEPEPFDPADYGLLASAGVQIAQPAWSPDGTELAWIVKGDLAGDGALRVGVGVFDLGTQTARVLHPFEPQGAGWPAAPVWSPDGKWLAFGDSSLSDKAGLWVAQMEEPWEEYHLGLGGNPVWGPDSQWLAFQSISREGVPSYVLAEEGTWEQRPLKVPLDRYGMLVDWINP